jgi:hypothetical protein
LPEFLPVYTSIHLLTSRFKKNVLDYHMQGFNVIKRMQRKYKSNEGKRKSKEVHSNNKSHPHSPSEWEEFDRKLIENRMKQARNARIEYAQKIDQRGVSIREQNIEKIKYCLSNSLDGLSTTELSKQTGIHRRMIFGICKELMEDDLVMKGKGKRGKYHLTPKALSTDSFVSFVFGHDAMERLLNPTDPKDIFSVENICTNKDSKFWDSKLARDIIEQGKSLCKHIDVPKHFSHEHDPVKRYILEQKYIRSHIPTAFLVNELALHLTEFANRVAFLIIYTLLQTLNPEQRTTGGTVVIVNKSKATSTRSITNKHPGTTSLSAVISGDSIPITSSDYNVFSDYKSMRWVLRAIDLKQLSNLFIRRPFITSRLKFEATTTPDVDTDILASSIFKMDQQDFDQLVVALKDTFPRSFYDEFENIRNAIQQKALQNAKERRI